MARCGQGVVLAPSSISGLQAWLLPLALIGEVRGSGRTLRDLESRIETAFASREAFWSVPRSVSRC